MWWTAQVKIWFQNRRMKWKRGKKASMEARAKQTAAAAGASSSTTDKSKSKPETRKPEATTERHVTDAVLHVNNNAAHARNANDYGPRSETGNVVCKTAIVGSSTGDLYARRPTSVIAFSVQPGKMVDEQRAYVSDRKSNLAPFGVMSLTWMHGLSVFGATQMAQRKRRNGENNRTLTLTYP